MIDNRDGGCRLSPAQIRSLCDRKRGIGADGVILIDDDSALDFRMRYYNSDGGEVEMCGNGARCAALFAVRLALGATREGKTRLRFATQPGPMRAEVEGYRVAVAMTDATSFAKSISLSVAGGMEMVHVINTGVPHAVVLEDGVSGMADEVLEARGRAIRQHPRFAPEGVNANFVSMTADGTVTLRTFERGVEAETLACGTGAVAAAVVLCRLGHVTSPVGLMTRGGERLNVSFQIEPTGASDVVLEGPAEFNFEGRIDLFKEG
jgi:diaminopimelate epimerase